MQALTALCDYYGRQFSVIGYLERGEAAGRSERALSKPRGQGHLKFKQIFSDEAR